jgi:hypothetical protein
MQAELRPPLSLPGEFSFPFSVEDFRVMCAPNAQYRHNLHLILGSEESFVGIFKNRKSV